MGVNRSLFKVHDWAIETLTQWNQWLRKKSIKRLNLNSEPLSAVLVAG